MRTIPELREEYKKLKRKYHTMEALRTTISANFQRSRWLE